MCIEEKSWLFGLHYEPVCYEPHTVGIHVLQETAPHIHAHKPRHTHASHIHTHNTMYAHVYTCTYWGRKGHLAKFCYDRVHNVSFVNRFVRVRKSANSHGPNRVWVPKFTPIVFDVGVASRLTWGHWCLNGGCFCA